MFILQVLAKDPTSVKALFRRGVAYSRLNNFDKAQADLLAAAKASPNGRLGGCSNGCPHTWC